MSAEKARLLSRMNDLEQMAIERLKAASDMSLMAYQQPLVICISGGKDSGVITELAVRSGIPCEFQHNHTTADAPETVRFVRSEFKRLEEKGYKCTVNMPTYKGQRVSMWSLIPQKLMPPTRLVRYCCSVLKETGGAGRFICTGVRWAESTSRKNSRGIYERLGATKDKKIILANDNDEKRMLFENCRLKAKRVVNPIIDWTDKDVHGFLEDAKVPMNPLYAEGQCRVDKFLGINEAADGDTELKMGEASRMENFLITDAYNLTLRPGIQRADFAAERTPAPILGSWAGRVGEDDLLVICDFYQNADRLFVYQRGADGNRHIVHQQTGALGLTSGENAMVKIFPFGGKLYVMSKGNTVVYKDGTFTAEAPYVPLVVTGAAPAGGGTTLENLNLLTALRRIEYSADGEATAYVLPEEAIGVTAITVDNVPKDVAASGSFDLSKHTYTFTTAPIKGVANVEFTYTTDATQAAENRLKILGCPLAEAYNGATDTRLFVAGDGTNLCYYTGVPQSGEVTALYFPAMNEVAVDMSGSPVTGLVRHYSKLLVFKPDGAFTISYEPVTLTDGSTIAGFYLRAANREFGNDVLGQIQTVENFPRTFSKNGIYEWRITSSYYKDERYAKRVSDRVMNSLNRADSAGIVTCDDNYSKTYYVFLNDDDGTVLVNRYALAGDGGLWCIYKSTLCKSVKNAMVHDGEMVFFTDTDMFFFSQEGLSRDAPVTASGDATAIEAVWESGFQAFGADFQRKYSSEIYVSMLPQNKSRMTITAATDRRSEYMEKEVRNELFCQGVFRRHCQSPGGQRLPAGAGAVQRRQGGRRPADADAEGGREPDGGGGRLLHSGKALRPDGRAAGAADGAERRRWRRGAVLGSRNRKSRHQFRLWRPKPDVYSLRGR